MRFVTAGILAIMVGACSTVPVDRNGWIQPVDAIRAANDDPSYGVRGEFVLTVRSIASDPQESFLDSERDYRDQRNLAIEMPTTLLPALERRLGVPFANLQNRRLVVMGVARRVRIDFVSDGRRSGKYYYQTHVRVDSPTQIRLLH
ncbi:MAG: hypothetical protein KGJ96_07870 [Xanthomonadaceae bacterium]|nr:hypothetical protein [Xanthomonadaceae bacterium]